MKKLIALTLALLMLALPALAETGLTAADDATLTITGSASVALAADYAQVSVGVSTKAVTVEAATEQNGAAIRSVIAALIAAGIPEDDIATSSYSVFAEYDYAGSESVLSGYNVSNQLSVIIRDMEHIGATLDEATRAGANSIYSVEFKSTQAANAQDEAMALAVKDAIRKAGLLAAAAGLETGSVISIAESSSMAYTVTASYKTDSARAATNNVILPDELSVSASVTVVFELK